MKPANITNAERLEESDLIMGDPVHISVVDPGSVTNDAEFVCRIIKENTVIGVIFKIQGEEVEVPWEDLMEFWALPPVLAHSGPRRSYRITQFTERLER